MPFKMEDAGGVLRTVTVMKVADAGGEIRTIRTAKVMDSGSTLRTVATFASAMTVAISPSAVFGFGFGAGSALSTTDPVTATPTGGLAPYTYAWTRLSGDGEAMSPTLATTTFRDDVPEGETTEGTFRVTVTDSAAQTATADVTASFTNSYSGGL